MPYYYAISDPHGCDAVLDEALAAVDLQDGSHLYLLGDYIPHQGFYEEDWEFLDRCETSLRHVRAYCQAHRGSVTALMGNHEYDLYDRVRYEGLEVSVEAKRFLMSLKQAYPYAETERQVFVHAGVDEDADDWRNETPIETFLDSMRRPDGEFEKDIISGHQSAAKLAGAPEDGEVFWDGKNHYVIDGNTEKSGKILILRYDCASGAYEQSVATRDGHSPFRPVVPAANSR